MVDSIEFKLVGILHVTGNFAPETFESLLQRTTHDRITPRYEHGPGRCPRRRESLRGQPNEKAVRAEFGHLGGSSIQPIT